MFQFQIGHGQNVFHLTPHSNLKGIIVTFKQKLDVIYRPHGRVLSLKCLKYIGGLRWRWGLKTHFIFFFFKGIFVQEGSSGTLFEHGQFEIKAFSIYAPPYPTASEPFDFVVRFEKHWFSQDSWERKIFLNYSSSV